MPLNGVVRRMVPVILLAFPLVALGARTSQVSTNHMRWNNRDAVLSNALAWQEERNGHWVTVVMLSDVPVPPESLRPAASAIEMLTAAGAQGLAFAVMTGGVPLTDSSVEVVYHDGEAIGSSTITGAGGFNIDIQSDTRIKGTVLLNPFTAGSRDESAWSVKFDAPVLNGDATKMSAEGDALPGGGDPGKDLLAAMRARLAMDYTALLAYASPETAEFLKDKARRQNNLEMLKSMTPAQGRVVGGLRNGNEALIYWVQLNPEAINSRCVETMSLIEGRWRTTSSACQSE